MKLEGKNALVTGGGRGVGRAICIEYAKEGANVIVNYASNDKAAKEVVGIIEGMGRKAVAVQGDVAKKEDAQKLVEACVQNFGSIHIVVNNAGISKPAMLHKMSVDVWDEVVNIQMRGPWLTIQAASKYFMEQNYGRIINVTCNVISLGIVTTEMTHTISTDEKLKEIYTRRILLNRYAEPEDVSPAFVFFASDDARYITGQLLCVDGGYGMT